jgi:hypothetical protein
MRTTAILTGVLIVFLFSGLATAGDLVIQKAKIRFAGDRSALSLIADLEGDGTKSYYPERDGLTLTIGSEVILSVPAVDDRAAWKMKGLWKHLYRERKSADREGVRKVVLDLGRNRLTVRARGLTLTRPADNVVTVTLVLGGSVYTSTETFRGEGTLRFKHAWKGTALDPNIGHNPPGPILHPPVGEPVNWRHLMSTGSYTGDGSSSKTQQRFARNATEWTAIWREFFGKPWDPMPIDFSNETGVAFLLGSRPEQFHGSAIVSVTELDGVVTVKWREETPGANCYLMGGGPYNLFRFIVLETTADKVVFEQLPTVKYRCL